MRFNIIIPEGHPVLVGKLEDTLNGLFRDTETDAHAHWYYDDCVEAGTEYGVVVDVSRLEREMAFFQLAIVAEYCLAQFGDIRMEVIQ